MESIKTSKGEKTDNQKKLVLLHKRFNEYTAPFISGNQENDRNIILKQKHTRRVCFEILNMADKLGLNDAEKTLCHIAALFHDIGRFEQYKQFNTFIDSDSVDHAVFGCKILEEENFLDILPEYEQALIKKAVLYHNRIGIPENESDDCLFYTRLLRDADKLDIWHVVTSYYDQPGKNKTLELGLPNTPGISDRVYQSLMNQEIVSKEDLKNLNDFKMLQMGWVYDLNFAPAFKRLSEKGYLEKIKAVLPHNDEKIDMSYNRILDYLSGVLNYE